MTRPNGCQATRCHVAVTSTASSRRSAARRARGTHLSYGPMRMAWAAAGALAAFTYLWRLGVPSWHRDEWAYANAGYRAVSGGTPGEPRAPAARQAADGRVGAPVRLLDHVRAAAGRRRGAADGDHAGADRPPPRGRAGGADRVRAVGRAAAPVARPARGPPRPPRHVRRRLRHRRAVAGPAHPRQTGALGGGAAGRRARLRRGVEGDGHDGRHTRRGAALASLADAPAGRRGGAGGVPRDLPAAAHEPDRCDPLHVDGAAHAVAHRLPARGRGRRLPASAVVVGGVVRVGGRAAGPRRDAGARRARLPADRASRRPRAGGRDGAADARRDHARPLLRALRLHLGADADAARGDRGNAAAGPAGDRGPARARAPSRCSASRRWSAPTTRWRATR